MRLSKDSTSWHAGGVIRRDERATKVDDQHRPVSGRKDTRKWCGGKVGREHELAVFERKWSFSTSAWHERCCTRCGKEFGRYYRSLGELFRSEPPQWFIDFTLVRPGDK